MGYDLEPISPSTHYLPEDLALAIQQLWRDPAIPKLLDEHSSEFDLMDSAPLYASPASRPAKPPILTYAQLLQGSPSNREAQLCSDGHGYLEITANDDRYYRNSVLDGRITVRVFVPPLYPQIPDPSC